MQNYYKEKQNDYRCKTTIKTNKATIKRHETTNKRHIAATKRCKMTMKMQINTNSYHCVVWSCFVSISCCFVCLWSRLLSCCVSFSHAEDVCQTHAWTWSERVFLCLQSCRQASSSHLGCSLCSLVNTTLGMPPPLPPPPSLLWTRWLGTYRSSLFSPHFLFILSPRGVKGNEGNPLTACQVRWTMGKWKGSGRWMWFIMRLLSFCRSTPGTAVWNGTPRL